MCVCDEKRREEKRGSVCMYIVPVIEVGVLALYGMKNEGFKDCTFY